MRNLYQTVREKLKKFNERMIIEWNNMRYIDSQKPSDALKTSFLGRDYLLEGFEPRK